MLWGVLRNGTICRPVAIHSTSFSLGQNEIVILTSFVVLPPPAHLLYHPDTDNVASQDGSGGAHLLSFLLPEQNFLAIANKILLLLVWLSALFLLSQKDCVDLSHVDNSFGFAFDTS